MEVRHALVGALLLAPAIALAQNYEYVGQASLTQVGVTPAIHAANTGAGVAIGIVDGWVDTRHIDIADDRVYLGKLSYTNWWHGSAVASVAAGALNGVGIVGVAPGAKVYNSNPWAYAGLSFGSPSMSLMAKIPSIVVVNQSYTGLATPIPSGEASLMALYKSKFVIVRAAGNSGLSAISVKFYPDPTVALSHLLIVGSVGPTNEISTFSNRPGEGCFTTKTSCGATQASSKTKNFFVVAPGEGVLAAHVESGTWAYFSGTSIAAPRVTGIAALVASDALAKGKKLTPTELATIIKVTATDLGAPGVDGVYGWGLVNAPRALAPVGVMSSVVVPGQASFDSFGRPYTADPVSASLAPTTAAWSVSTMGQMFRFSTSFVGGKMNMTMRQAMVDDTAALNMVGLERRYNRVTIGLSAGALHETYTLLGNLTGEPSVTRLGGVDLGIQLDAKWSLGAFYMRGVAGGYPADTYGIGLSFRDTIRLNLVKPLSVTSASVPVGYASDGSVAYATLAGARPWAAVLSYRREW